MLVERERDLERLNELLDGAASSGRRVVLVPGEAGLGKTSLVSVFLDDIADRAHVLSGDCDDLLIPQPLGPVWDMAREEPTLLGPLERKDARAVMEALFALASRSLRPTVVVVEDLQWADDGTLDLVRFLGRRASSLHGLLLLTFRDNEVHDEHPLRAVIGGLPPSSLERISLKPLSRDGVAAMIGTGELDPDRVVDLTGGNPLFVHEIVMSGTEHIPASISASILARVATLTPRARRLLDVVSVMLGDVDIELVELLIGGSRVEQSECERRGLLRFADGAVRYSHEVVRRVVESALSSADRRHLNQQVLAALPVTADPSTVVHHARKAGDIDTILQAAPLAARVAMDLGSHREALAHLSVLEPHLARFDPIEQAGTLVDVARVEFYMEQRAALDHLERGIELLRVAGAELELANALTLGIRVMEHSGLPDHATACAEEAISILEAHPPSSDLAFALNQQGWLHLMLGSWERALELTDRALAVAELVGDQRTIVDSAITRAIHLLTKGDRAGFRLLEECRSRAEEHGLHFEEARALLNLGLNSWPLRPMDQAIEALLRARATAERYDILSYVNGATGALAYAWLESGDWIAAESAALEALESHTAQPFALYALACLYARSDRPRAAAMVERLWTEAHCSAEPQHLDRAAAAAAEYMWLTGDVDAGRLESIKSLHRVALASGFEPTRSQLTFWLWKLGLLDEIPGDLWRPFLAVMRGEPEEGAEKFQLAGRPYDRALALMHGDDQAQLEALGVFQALGARLTARRLRRALHERGVRVPRRRTATTRSHPAGLTSRQAEVLDLVAQGLTSHQIGDHLFISSRTVDNHIAAIVLKLDARDRQDAVAIARRVGAMADE